MKRYHRDLLLVISIFFIAVAFAEEPQCCSDKTVYAVHKERAIVRVSDSKRAHEMSRAKGLSGGGSLIRPKGKKNRAMASITISASLALLHVTIATLVHLFLY